MPFSPRCFPSRSLLVSQVQSFIPRKWKRRTIQVDVQNDHSSTISQEETVIVSNDMIDSLLATLKDLTSQGHLFSAFRTFSLIQYHASSRGRYEFYVQPINSLLLLCTNLRSVSQGKQIHSLTISMGYEHHLLLVPKLVTFYSNIDLFVDAHRVADYSNIMHPLPWNLLIASYARNGRNTEALSAYEQMASKGIKPDKFTYPSVLKACAEEFDLEFGRKVHNSIDADGLEWNLFVQNALVSMYGKCGEVSVARNLFEKMPERDAISWNSIISAYASKGMWEVAFQLFESMQREGVELNRITWNTIAGGCLRTGNFRRALDLLSQMRACGIQLDCVAMLVGLGACSHIGSLKLGREIHGSVIRSFYDEFDNVRNTLITMYSRCKHLGHAYVLFQLMETKSVITWNSMLSGYCHMDCAEEASFLFRKMLLSGVEPNYITVASVLPLCARVANLQHGKEFHCYLLRRERFNHYLLIWNALIDMYARSGKVLEAKRVFDSLSMKDEVTYTSLIAGYGMQGKAQTALKLFEEMNNLQIRPDHVTMIAVLSTCSHSGLLRQGQILFEKMQCVYGLTPHLEHFACMVDLFGRAGLLNKARETITRMPYRPTSAMWATLLGACRIHGNMQIGEWAAEKLLEMKPENSGYYTLIANMYAAAGNWYKLAKVRTFMRDFGVRKDPGCAWVDVGSEFIPFMVGDTSNPHANDIYPLLYALTKAMKDDGYTINEGFCLDEDISEE